MILALFKNDCLNAGRKKSLTDWLERLRNALSIERGQSICVIRPSALLLKNTDSAKSVFLCPYCFLLSQASSNYFKHLKANSDSQQFSSLARHFASAITFPSYCNDNGGTARCLMVSDSLLLRYNHRSVDVYTDTLVFGYKRWSVYRWVGSCFVVSIGECVGRSVDLLVHVWGC